MKSANVRSLNRGTITGVAFGRATGGSAEIVFAEPISDTPAARVRSGALKRVVMLIARMINVRCNIIWLVKEAFARIKFDRSVEERESVRLLTRDTEIGCANKRRMDGVDYMDCVDRMDDI